MSKAVARQRAFVNAARDQVSWLGNIAQTDQDELMYAAALHALEQAEQQLGYLESSSDPVLTALQMSVEGTLPRDVFHRVWREQVAVMGRSGLNFVQQTGKIVPEEVEIFLERLDRLSYPEMTVAAEEKKKDSKDSLLHYGIAAGAGVLFGRYVWPKLEGKESSRPQKELPPPKEEEEEPEYEEREVEDKEEE